jgi:geranylgeranyl transferase type-1 subunit beta
MTVVQFEKQRHITYWLRCLKMFLPAAYQSLDGNRMMIVYFSLSALDLLDSLFSKTTETERMDYADWIYSCQHPDGGFRASPLTALGDQSTKANAAWDPASVPSTCFALCSLVILRDDLSRFKKAKCLEWLKMMQRPDGSFGQTLGDGGEIEGGYDTRFGYTAMGICWLLGELHEVGDGERKADNEALARRIVTLQVSQINTRRNH